MRPENSQSQTEFAFTLKDCVARGGFGEVYRAVRNDTGVDVAVKVLRDFRNDDCRRRFEREVRTLIALNGRNGIVPILGHNLTAEPPYYVMPLMEGGTLAEHAGKLEHGIVRGLLRHFAETLQYLHGRGGLHRDFKPANVLLDGSGLPALGDFGLGNDPQCTVILTAHACGTPGYMAPELSLPFGSASAASDVYALGATIFELLTGVAPSKAANLDPWAYNKQIPEDLRNMVLHMVQPHPGRRPTPETLLTWLGPGDGVPTRVPVPPSLSKVLVWLGVAALALVAIVAVFKSKK